MNACITSGVGEYISIYYVIIRSVVNGPLRAGRAKKSPCTNHCVLTDKLPRIIGGSVPCMVLLASSACVACVSRATPVWCPGTTLLLCGALDPWYHPAVWCPGTTLLGTAEQRTGAQTPWVLHGATSWGLDGVDTRGCYLRCVGTGVARVERDAVASEQGARICARDGTCG